MRRGKVFLSALIALSILLSVWLSASEQVRAFGLANGKELTNVKFKDNVLTWDPIPNLDDSQDYPYTIYFKNAALQKGTSITSVASNKADLVEIFDSFLAEFHYKEDDSFHYESGQYEIRVTGNDKSGQFYSWSGTVDYVDKLLHKITNLELKDGFLTWEHDVSNLPESTEVTYYFSITIDGESDYDKQVHFSTKETRFPVQLFAYPGTHEYKVHYYAAAEGYIYGGREGNKDLGTITFDGPFISGVKIEDNILSWDPYPDANEYRIYYSCDSKSGVTTAEETQLDLKKLLYKLGSGIAVQLRIYPYKDDERLTTYAQADYTIDTSGIEYYPVYVNGNQLDSINGIDRYLGDAKYFPKDNRIVFKKFTTFGNEDIISSTEDLIIEGTGRYEGTIECEKDIIFADGCDLTISTQNETGKPAVHASNIIVKGGELDVSSYSAEAFRAENNISFSKKLSSVVLVSDSFSAITIGNKLILNGLGIAEPSEGRWDPSLYTIVDHNGIKALTVKIAHVTTTPKPTLIVTAKPTAKVTAKVTSKPSDPKSSILSFVERIYKYVLDREPEAEGAEFWTDELYSFRRTGAEVGLGFIFSDEFINRGLSDEEFVTVLYNTFFGREPEEEGFKFWISALRDGTLDRVAVADGFVYSQEWADTCASYGIRSGGEIKPSNEIEPTDATYAFIERMYTTAMNRASDEEGAKYWANELANFRFTGEQVGVMFFLSDEMNGFGLSDDEFVTRLYKTFMDRDPEEEGFNFWTGYLSDGGSREGAVLGFTRSDEFISKCIDARILPY